MKFFVIRKTVSAQLEVPTPSQCVHIPSENLIPREILQNADFVFQVQKDNTVTFYKKRSDGKNKTFFNLSLAIKHIQRHYDLGMNVGVKIESFEEWNLACLHSMDARMAEIEFYVKRLREGV